jgi:hypothetical protein
MGCRAAVSSLLVRHARMLPLGYFFHHGLFLGPGDEGRLPHRQRVGALKKQHGRAIQDPGKESFAPGSHFESPWTTCHQSARSTRSALSSPV